MGESRSVRHESCVWTGKQELEIKYESSVLI